MPEQAGGELRPELDPRIKDYFIKRGLDVNDIPPRSYAKLASWPTGEIPVLVKVLTDIGIALEQDPPRDEGEGLESGKPTTPLGKYQFMIH
jgi:hypothetical protein